MDAQPKKFSDLGVSVTSEKFVGEKIKLVKVLNTEIVVHKYKLVKSKYPERGSENCLWLQISVEGKKHVAFSIAKYLIQTIELIPKDAFPFSTKIVNNNEIYEFT